MAAVRFENDETTVDFDWEEIARVDIVPRNQTEIRATQDGTPFTYSNGEPYNVIAITFRCARGTIVSATNTRGKLSFVCEGEWTLYPYYGENDSVSYTVRCDNNSVPDAYLGRSLGAIAQEANTEIVKTFYEVAS
jgi:hypothetical protein